MREDYSANGDAWNYFTHEQALSRAYRWGEDGIAGFSDDELRWCLSLALWNGSDPFLKERLFGLTNAEGNHGEDVKELYFYLDATPTHSYLRMLYKYPQARFPYEELRRENARRTTHDPEYEILDTGVFDENRYFDVTVEYAKATPDDILMRVTVINRADRGASLHLLPQLFTRNIWSWDDDSEKPWLRRRRRQGARPTIPAWPIASLPSTSLASSSSARTRPMCGGSSASRPPAPSRMASMISSSRATRRPSAATRARNAPPM